MEPAHVGPPSPSSGGYWMFATFARGAKTLWIASAGGHVTEALEIERTIGAHKDSLWVVPRHPQTVSMLEGRRRLFVENVVPRDAAAAWRVGRRVRRLVREESFDRAISTGSAIAAFSLPAAAAAGVPAVYVESLARADGPSLTGRLLRLAPGVATYTQYRSWASAAWRYDGSVLAGYEVTAASDPSLDRPRRILVSLGTIEPYRFDRAVRAVLAALQPSDDVTWQVGATTGLHLPGVVERNMAPDALGRAMRDADVVVVHAGVGTILQALDAGHVPLLAVRHREHGEHVDNHQMQLAGELSRRGLAIELDLNGSNTIAFDAVRSRHVVREESPVGEHGGSDAAPVY